MPNGQGLMRGKQIASFHQPRSFSVVLIFPAGAVAGVEEKAI